MMKTKPDAKPKDKTAKLPRECFYRNKKRRVYDPRDLGGMKYCYCDYPFEANPNADLLEFPKTPGKRCPCIAINKRYEAAMKREKTPKASKQKFTTASSASVDALSFGVDASTFGTYLIDDNAANPTQGDANEADDIVNDIDVNDSIDYLSNQKMKKKAFAAHEAWNSCRDVLRKLYFKATIAGPKSCVETTIGSGCASDELCSAECVPYLTHKAVRVFCQHAHVNQTFVYCCRHSSLVEEMVLQHVLPASPTKPKSGVSFALLKEIRNFSLIGKIPVASWVEYLNESNSAPKKMRINQSILGDTLFEYTCLILYCEEYILSTFQLDLAPRCGACHVSDRLKISMDGNFTLKKFKTRGQDVQTYPLHEENLLWPESIKTLSRYENEKMSEKDLVV